MCVCVCVFFYGNMCANTKAALIIIIVRVYIVNEKVKVNHKNHWCVATLEKLSNSIYLLLFTIILFGNHNSLYNAVNSP